MDKIVNEYRIYVKGLFGRNRTVKSEGFSLIEKPIDDPILTESELDSLVENRLKEIKLKNGRVSVNVNKVTYENNHGYTTKIFMPFDAKTLKVYTI